MERENSNRNSSKNKMLMGLLFIGGGILLLLNKAGITFLPAWFFTWPVLIIAIAIVVGLQHNFRNFGWLILFAWGVYALIDQQVPSLNLKQYTAPVVLIFLGLFFLARRNKRFKKNWQKDYNWNKRWNDFDAKLQENFPAEREDGEFIDITSVFSGSKKVVFSKNFKGGDITCFMGGAEIDLSQADVQGRAVIDATSVFGGIKIIVPSNWDVKIENTAAFGSVEDKRRVQNFAADLTKQLIISGTAVFGGIEITNY